MPSEERTPGQRSPGQGDPAARRNEADAWGAFGLVVSGVLVWGGVGWLLSQWLDNPVPVPVGLLVGMAAGLYLVWFRYGRT
jgi:F0F1-type ATP synthase assembly protein I